MKYQLADGNIIIATQDYINSHHPDAVLVEDLVTETEVPANNLLTVLAFRNRFTAAEKTAIELAMLDDPTAPMEKRQQAAMLRAFDKDLGVAEYVDLSFQQVIDGVHALESFGLIAEGRAEEVLTIEAPNDSN